MAKALQNFPRKDAVRLQCAHVRRRSARFLIRPVMRFVAQTPGRACVYLLLTTVILGGAMFSLVEDEDKGNWIDGDWQPVKADGFYVLKRGEAPVAFNPA